MEVFRSEHLPADGGCLEHGDRRPDVTLGAGGNLLEQSIAAYEMFRGADEPQAGYQGACLDGSEQEGFGAGTQLGRYILEGIGDENDRLPGFFDDIQQRSRTPRSAVPCRLSTSSSRIRVRSAPEREAVRDEVPAIFSRAAFVL
jgi:hypothetical protein